MFSVTDWALKRVLKFILKRNLGRYLKNEVDLEQLDVQLGKGIWELRNVLLNCDTVNQQLVGKGWILKAGYCGCLRANIQVSGFGASKCAIELDELLLTVAPDPTPGTPAAPPQQPANDSSAAEPFISLDDIGLGQLGVVEGIRKIAGGIQSLLQHLTVAAKNITIRVELPVPSSGSSVTVLTFRCELVEYSDRTAGAGATATPSSPPTVSVTLQTDLVKQVLVRGLTVETGAAHAAPAPPLPLGFTSPPSSGMSPSSNAPDGPVMVLSAPGRQGIALSLQLKMLPAGTPTEPPKLQADVSLGPTRVLLLPSQLPLMSGIATFLQAHAAATSPPPPPIPPTHALPGVGAGAYGGTDLDGSLHQGWGQRSFVEDLFFPDCQGLVADTLSSSHVDLLGSVYPGSSLHDEFHEARSMFSSVTTSMLASTNSAYSGYMYSSAIPSQQREAADFQFLSESHLFTSRGPGMVPAAVPARTPGPAPGPPWSAHVTAADLCIMLCYPALDHSTHSRICAPIDALQQPRLALQCCDLSIACDSAGRQSTITAKVQQLEVAEYLPPGSACPGTPGACAVEFTAVPQMLPQAPHGPRPLPQHLRPSQQGTSSRTRSPHRLDAAPGAALEIWPLLCCGGTKARGEASRPSMCVTIRSEPGRRNGVTNLDADLELQPVTLWVNMGAVQRLVAVLEPASSIGTKSPEPTASGSSRGGRDGRLPRVTTAGAAPREHVQVVIDSILDDLRQCNPQQSHSAAGQRSVLETFELSASVSVPHVCLVVMLPGAVVAAGTGDVPPVLHGQKYAALDLLALQDSVPASARHRNARAATRHMPVVKLQKASETTGVVARDVATVDVAVASVKVHLLGTPRIPAGQQQQRQQQQLTATCVLELKVADCSGPRPAVGPDDVPAGCAVYAQLKWDPSAKVAPGAVEDALVQAAAHSKDRWAEPEGEWERHSAFNSVRFQERIRRSSPVFAHVRAPQVVADFSRSDLLAIWQLLCSWLYATAQPQYIASNTAPIQVCLLLSCRLECSLHSASAALRHTAPATAAVEPARPPNDAASGVTAFTASVEELTLFQVSNLGGVLGASAVSVEVQGLGMVGGPSRSCLLHSPAMVAPGGAAQTCVDVLHVAKPEPGPRLEVMRTLSSLVVRGVTVLADYGCPGFNWGLELGSFFQLPMPDTAAVAPCQQVAEVVVNLEDVALRYEPFQENPNSRTPRSPTAAAPAAGAAPAAPAPPVAAVLMLEGLRWHLRPGETQQEVGLHNLSVHIAPCHRRGVGWQHSQPKAVGPSTLQAAGYHCVAQEGALKVVVRPADANVPHSAQEVEISNQHLCGSLTQDSAVLLAQLAVQCAAAAAAAAPPAPAPPPRRPTSSADPVAPTPAAVPAAAPSTSPASASNVRLMEGLREDAFRSGSPVDPRPGAASIFVEGRWFEQQDSGDDSVSGTISEDERSSSGPLVVEDYFLMVNGSEAGTAYEEQSTTAEDLECEDGMWFGEGAPVAPNAGPMLLREDYMQLPTEAAGPSPYCILPLRSTAQEDAGPWPVSRILLSNLSLLLVLHAKSPTGRAGAPYEGRVEMELEGLSVLLEDFGASGNLASRLAVNLNMLEVRDCSVRSDSGNRWSRVLSLRSAANQLRDRRTPMLHVTLEAVRPAPQEQPQLQEFRLLVGLLPLRLRLDQDVVMFLAAFGKAVEQALPPPAPPVQADAEDGMYFQRCEVRGFSLLVDYRPRRVDLAALRDGSLLELLNLVPWGGIDIQLKGLRLAGLTGWDGLAAAVAKEWLDDIARTQAYKFVVGIAPINSICRVSSAMAVLLRPAGSTSRGAMRTLPDSRLRRQLQRSTTSFVRALLHEALGFGATVAAGAQLLLQGSGNVQYSPEQPNTVMEGLQQAAKKLSSGFEAAAREMVIKPARSIRGGESVKSAVVEALRAAPGAAVHPAAAAAAAVRCTLLGVRNALDPGGRID